MNILLISWFYPPEVGGIPSLLSTLFKQWNGKGHTFYHLNNAKGDVKYHSVKEIHSIHYLELRRLTQTYEEIEYTTWASLSSAIDTQVDLLCEELKRYQIDFVFAHTEKIAALKIAERLQVPFLSVMHGVMPTITELKNVGVTPVRHYNWIMDAMIQMEGGFSFVSNFAKEKWKRLGFDPRIARVIYNPIDFTLFCYKDNATLLKKQLEIPVNGKVIVYPQRPNRAGLNDMVECLNKLTNEEQIYVLICGSDNEVLELEHKERVRYKKFTYSEMATVYSMSDVTVLPTQDAFGLPFIESLACGTPVVCNDKSAFAELLSEECEAFPDRVSYFHNKCEMYNQLREHIKCLSRKETLLTDSEKSLFLDEKVAANYLSFIEYLSMDN